MLYSSMLCRLLSIIQISSRGQISWCIGNHVTRKQWNCIFKVQIWIWFVSLTSGNNGAHQLWWSERRKGCTAGSACCSKITRATLIHYFLSLCAMLCSILKIYFVSLCRTAYQMIWWFMWSIKAFWIYMFFWEIDCLPHNKRCLCPRCGRKNNVLFALPHISSCRGSSHLLFLQLPWRMRPATQGPLDCGLSRAPT